VYIYQLEVTEAVMDLVMKPNERINVFYVRVKWAMEVKNHSISLEDKALAPYIAIDTGTCLPSSWPAFPLNTGNLPCQGKTHPTIQLPFKNAVPS
jgi:hypothetical protein